MRLSLCTYRPALQPNPLLAKLASVTIKLAGKTRLRASGEAAIRLEPVLSRLHFWQSRGVFQI